MEISLGNYEVIFSGSVIGVDNEDIKFKFPEKYSELKIILTFKNDKKIKGNVIKREALGKKTLVLAMFNTQDMQEYGNSKLLYVGFIGNRKLYFNYRAYEITNLSKTIHYTFYLGEEGSYAG